MTDSFERSENQQPNSNEHPDSQGNSQYTGIFHNITGSRATVNFSVTLFQSG